MPPPSLVIVGPLPPAVWRPLQGRPFFLFDIHSAVGQASRRLSLASSSLDQDFQNSIGPLRTKILPKAMECFHLWGHASKKEALRIWVPCVSSGTQGVQCVSPTAWGTVEALGWRQVTLACLETDLRLPSELFPQVTLTLRLHSFFPD